MALKIADRIKELSNTTGTGPFHLTGATVGYGTAASALADGDTAYFGAFDGAGTWVIFLGTYNATPNTVTVNTVLSSSPGYAGFATAPTVWIDSPAALLAKILPVMPSNDNIVGANLQQTLTKKTISDQLVIGGVTANVFPNPNGILLTRAGNTTVENGIGDSSTYTQNVNGSAYCSFNSQPTILGGPVGNIYSFESLPTINVTGNLIWLIGMYAGYHVSNAGATVQTRVGLFITDDSGSVGTVTGNYGIYMNQLTRGSTIYALYCQNSVMIQQFGTTPIYLFVKGDNSYIVCQSSGGNAATLGCARAVGGSSYSVSDMLMSSTGTMRFAPGNGGDTIWFDYPGTITIAHPNGNYGTLNLTNVGVGNWVFTGDGSNNYFNMKFNASIFMRCNTAGAFATGSTANSGPGGGGSSWYADQINTYGFWMDCSTPGWVNLNLRQYGTNSASYLIYTSNGNGVVGGCVVSGTSTSWATSSDYRLKDVRGDANTAAALALVNRIPLRHAKFKCEDGDVHFRPMVLAHEVKELFPDCVFGEKDATRMQKGFKLNANNDYDEEEVPAYQMIDFGKFGAPHLIAAIQELTKRLEAMERINGAQAR